MLAELVRPVGEGPEIGVRTNERGVMPLGGDTRLHPTSTKARKAAEDSRTPGPRGRSSVQPGATASWSAAVLCRFELCSFAGEFSRKLQALRLVTLAATNF